MNRIKILLSGAAFAALTLDANAQSWLTNGLVAYYPFDGNASNAVNGSQAVVNGNPTPAPDRNGRSNGALHFDGLSDLNIGSFPGLGKALTAFTVSFWFNTRGSGNFLGDDQLASQTSYTFACDFDTWLEPNSQYALTEPWEIGRVVLFPPDPPVTTNKWFSLVYSLDGSGHAAAYVNGTLEDTAAYDPQQNYGTGSDWFVGRGLYFPGVTWYRGEIDELRIYSRALTASEVAQLYAIESESPQTSIAKAVRLDHQYLSVGTNYQLQVSSDMNSWTNLGAPFTATAITYSQYVDVQNWSQFFRLHHQ